MAINKLPDARDLEFLRRRMSTQFQIPSAYDDALSYQGLIYKLIQYLKDTMQNVEDWNVWLEDFVGTFETKLQDTVRGMFQELYDNGQLAELTADVISVVQDQIDDVNSQIDAVSGEVILARGISETLGARLNVSDAQLVQKATYVDNVATMKSDNRFKVNDIVVTLGYYAPNDKGDGTYKIVDDGTLVDDGGSVHALNNGLKAKLITDKEVNVKQFGAKGDNVTDDIIPIQKTVDYAKTLITKVLVSRDWGYVGAVVRVPSGRYLISDTIYLYEGIVFVGDDRNTTMITLTDEENERAITNKFADAVDGYRMVTIKDVTFIHGGIYLLKAYRSYVKNVNIYGHENMNGILAQLAVEVIIEDVFMQYCRTGIYLSGGAGVGPSTTNKINRVWLSWCGTGMKISSDGNYVMTSSVRDSIVEYSTVMGIEVFGLTKALTFDTIHFEQNAGRDLAINGENKNLVITNIFSDVVGNRIAFLTGAGTAETTASLHNVGVTVFLQVGFAGKIYCSGTTDDLGGIPESAQVYNYPPTLYVPTP